MNKVINENQKNSFNEEVSIFSNSPSKPHYWGMGGRIQLYKGDSIELLKKCRSSIFDLIFADPPYFLSNGGITCKSGKVACVNKGEWDKAESFENMHLFNLQWLQECKRILKKDGAIFVSGTSHNIFSVGYAMQCLGYKILNDIIWYKINPPPNISCRYFVHSTETILWAKRDKNEKHYFNYERMKAMGDPISGKQMHSLWRILPPTQNEKRYGKHPTQKPEKLLDRIIQASTKTGNIILDPFCGSGTTGVVSTRLNRSFIGFDINSDYLDLASRRIKDETNHEE